MLVLRAPILRISGLLMLLVPHAAMAQSFVVHSGDLTSTKIMSNPGDVGIIEAGGTIIGNVNKIDGVSLKDINQTFINSAGGFLFQSGDRSAAILSKPTSANAVIINSGTILATGNPTYGIASLGDDAVVRNTGMITTSGPAGIGILSAGHDAIIANDGFILSSGFPGFGVLVNGADNVFTNTGSIETTNTASAALLIGDDGDRVHVVNSGRIFSPLDNTVSAIIVGTGADAVTLDLLVGSVVQGQILFNGTAGVVNIGRGQNAALTIHQSKPLVFNTAGMPFAIDGSLLAVVDTTGFGAEDEMLSDLTGSIAGAVDDRQDSKPHGAGAWLQGISSFRNPSSRGSQSGFDNVSAGLMVGVDRELSTMSRGGFFLGHGFAEMETDSNSQRIESRDYFLGVYGDLLAGDAFLNLQVTVGVRNFEDKRRILNNLVLGGIEHAKSDYEGTFISPQVTLGTSWDMGSFALRPSLTGRYAFMHLSSIAETGSDSNLSVAGRSVEVVDATAEIAAVSAPADFDFGAMQWTLRLGLEASLRDNSSVDARLLGQPIVIDPSGKSTVFAGYAGFDAALTLQNGWQLRSASDFSLADDNAFLASSSFSLNIPL